MQFKAILFSLVASAALVQSTDKYSDCLHGHTQVYEAMNLSFDAEKVGWDIAEGAACTGCVAACLSKVVITYWYGWREEAKEWYGLLLEDCKTNPIVCSEYDILSDECMDDPSACGGGY